ncbi:MAG: glycosyltransferase family 4 protein, partial [Ignavibacteriaceae bacterium]|nr:glycosyltransferase family 4 protein [Ignavibacteriaceae bacterium]
MEKTKILYIITSLGIGGAEKLLLYYLKNLDKNKYSLNVCCLREKPDDLYLEILKYAAVINLKIKNKFNPIAVLFIFKLFRKIRPDIIHTHLFQPRIYASIAHLFYRRAVLITQKHSIVNPKKHNVFILFELLSIRINKKVIAISESVKNSLTKYEFVPENKIFVLPNCIDYQKYHNGKIRESISNKKELVIGTVGRLEPEKGLNYLLLAMKIILTRFPTVKLDIIGDGSALSELKNLSSKLNISNSVNFLGKFVDVIPFYNRMDIFVLPSILEGFGIVLLEAMAAGIPIVATNVDGIREVVINMRSGLLVPPKSPKAIADAITNLIDNPQLRTNLVQEGLIRAKEFDVKAHVMKLDSLYTNL